MNIQIVMRAAGETVRINELPRLRCITWPIGKKNGYRKNDCMDDVLFPHFDAPSLLAL
jgi:hypothetical protein